MVYCLTEDLMFLAEEASVSVEDNNSEGIEKETKSEDEEEIETGSGVKKTETITEADKKETCSVTVKTETEKADEEESAMDTSEKKDGEQFDQSDDEHDKEDKVRVNELQMEIDAIPLPESFKNCMYSLLFLFPTNKRIRRQYHTVKPV